MSFVDPRRHMKVQGMDNTPEHMDLSDYERILEKICTILRHFLKIACK